MKKYKYKDKVYSEDKIIKDLDMLLIDVARQEVEVSRVYRGADFYVGDEFIGNDDSDDLEDIVDKLIENGIDIEIVGNDEGLEDGE